MRHFLAVAAIVALTTGCNCPNLGPCAPVDHEGWTTFFSSWGQGCDDCCPYGGCFSGSYGGPPANPRGLYRYSDDSAITPGEIIPIDPEAVPPPPSQDGAASGGDLNT